MTDRYHGKHNHVDRLSTRAIAARAKAQGFELVERRKEPDGVIIVFKVAGTQVKTEDRDTLQTVSEQLANLESAEVARVLRAMPTDYSLWECLNSVGTRKGFMVLDDMGGLLFEGCLNSYEVVRELEMDEWRRGMASRKAAAARERL